MKNKSFTPSSFGSTTRTARDAEIESNINTKIKELGIDPYGYLDGPVGATDQYIKDEAEALGYIYDHKEVPDELKQRIINNPNKHKHIKSYDVTNDNILINFLNKHWK